MPVENEHFVAEALRIVEEAEQQGIRLRILGSLAYRIHCPENLELFAKMERALTDIDFAGEKKQSKQIKASARHGAPVVMVSHTVLAKRSSIGTAPKPANI